MDRVGLPNVGSLMASDPRRPGDIDHHLYDFLNVRPAWSAVTVSSDSDHGVEARSLINTGP